MADSGEPTRQKHRPWKPGESGNPAGRPKGSRNKLSEEFIADRLVPTWSSGTQRGPRDEARGLHQGRCLVAAAQGRSRNLRTNL